MTSDSSLLPPRSVRRAYPETAMIDTWSAPDGWELRRYRQPAKARVPQSPDSPLPSIRGNLLFLGGRADYFEKYLEALDHWAERGWNVTSFDWRGQGGSGRLSDNPHAGHCEDFTAWRSDLASFVADWKQMGGTGPWVIVAHSMGGHLLLRAMLDRLVVPDAAILAAPMLGLNSAPLPSWLAMAMAALFSRLGMGRRPAWRTDDERMAASDDSRPQANNWRQSRLTRDAARRADGQWWLKEHPGLLLGGPTWNWLWQAFLSTRELMGDERLGRINVPVLILGARKDRLVSAEAIKSVAGRLPHARLHLYGPECGHEILREVDTIRDDALARIDAFLDEQAPAT